MVAQAITELRVSMTSQELQKSKCDILPLTNAFGIGPAVWVEETASGRIS